MERIEQKTFVNGPYGEGVFGFDGAISARGVDYPSNWEKLEYLKKLGLVFTFCHGNALRSRVAALTLRGLGIPTFSAAFGDITKQINKDFPPDSVMRFMNRHVPSRHELGRWAPGRIRQATPLMAACAEYMLVYCHESYLPAFVDPNDPRVHLMFAKDPRDETEYLSTYEAVVEQTVDFFHSHYRDRSIAMTCPNLIIAGTIHQRIDVEMAGLDFSRVPREWGNPFGNFQPGGEEF